MFALVVVVFAAAAAVVFVVVVLLDDDNIYFAKFAIGNESNNELVEFALLLWLVGYFEHE